jgi:RNA polymerase sigma-70 factor (ECF subfamily)
MTIAKGNLIDHQLVSLAQSGDLEAYGLLVEKYQNRLYRLILQVIKNQAVVEDIVQESLIKAYRSIASFKGDSAFYTWLYKIGLNTAKKYVHEKKHSLQFDSSDAHKNSENGSSAFDLYSLQTPKTELISDQIAETINDSISALPADLQTAITLREIEGLSYEQISEIMHCPIGTTRSRIFSARNIISEKLKPLLSTQQD